MRRSRHRACDAQFHNQPRVSPGAELWTPKGIRSHKNVQDSYSSEQTWFHSNKSYGKVRMLTPPLNPNATFGTFRNISYTRPRHLRCDSFLSGQANGFSSSSSSGFMLLICLISWLISPSPPCFQTRNSAPQLERPSTSQNSQGTTSWFTLPTMKANDTWLPHTMIWNSNLFGMGSTWASQWNVCVWVGGGGGDLGGGMGGQSVL